MRELFFSECRRFRFAALIAASVHLVVLLVLNRLIDMLQRRGIEYRFLASFYVIAGLAFAFFQFAPLRQPSRWMWLMHRPLAPSRIFAATALASATLIAFAVGLPALIATACVDLLTARTVDLRHYALCVQVAMLVTAAWLCGSYTILNRSYSAIIILVLPLLLASQLAAAPAMLLLSALCLALLAYIVLAAFKPDRKAPLRGMASVAAALPLQVGFYLALTLGGSVLWQSAYILVGDDPLNRTVPLAGGYLENNRSESASVLRAGLNAAKDTRAQAWLRELPQRKAGRIEWSIDSYPVHHQAGNLEHPEWWEDTPPILWTFSHDSMRFEGRDRFTGRAAGTIGLRGKGDSTPFPAVPLVRISQVRADASKTPGFVIPHAAYEYDPASAKLRQLVALAPPEILAGEPARQAGSLFVVTNQRLLELEETPGAAPLREKLAIALPGPFTDLDRIDTVAVDGGRLISFSFGRKVIDGSGEAEQVLMHVDANGTLSTVARRAFNHDWPVLFEHHQWWVSPVLYSALALPAALFDEGKILDAGATRDTDALMRARPAAAWAAAAFSSLAAALLAWAWMRRTPVGVHTRVGSIVACLVFGLPCVLCLMVLQPRPPPRVPLPKLATAAA